MENLDRFQRISVITENPSNNEWLRLGRPALYQSATSVQRDENRPIAAIAWARIGGGVATIHREMNQEGICQE